MGRGCEVDAQMLECGGRASRQVKRSRARNFGIRAKNSPRSLSRASPTAASSRSDRPSTFSLDYLGRICHDMPSTASMASIPWPAWPDSEDASLSAPALASHPLCACPSPQHNTTQPNPGWSPVPFTFYNSPQQRRRKGEKATQVPKN